MKKMKVSEIARFLSEYPSFGIKALEVPFVLVLKTNTGVVVSYQNEHFQRSHCIGNALFPNDVFIQAVIDVNCKNNKHCIVIASELPSDSNEKDTEIEFYLLGETNPDTNDVTAFLAYEAEKDRSVRLINIIEDKSEKTIFSDARRYGRDSSKLLKSQLKMFMALAGIDSATRRNIVSGGGFLQTTPTNVEEE